MTPADSRLRAKALAALRGEVDGPRVCYCIEPRALRRLKVLVAGM